MNLGSETVYSCKYTSFKVFIALVSLLHIDLFSLYTKHPFMHSEKKKSRDIYMIYIMLCQVSNNFTRLLYLVVIQNIVFSLFPKKSLTVSVWISQW